MAWFLGSYLKMTWNWSWIFYFQMTCFQINTFVMLFFFVDYVCWIWYISSHVWCRILHSKTQNYFMECRCRSILFSRYHTFWSMKKKTFLQITWFWMFKCVRFVLKTWLLRPTIVYRTTWKYLDRST